MVRKTAFCTIFVLFFVCPISEPSIVEFPSDTQVTEGEEVYLRVKVGGHPPPSLTWYHDGRKVTADYATELDEDGGISFPSVEAKHAGEYRLQHLQCIIMYCTYNVIS